MKPMQGFLAAAVRNFYINLSKVKQDDLKLVHALKLQRDVTESI